ncbi:MAG: cyclic nucleotide-binding domain-containing protein [Candidatus Krumholzibacteriia bacterium]
MADGPVARLTVIEKIILLRGVDFFAGLTVQDVARLAEIAREARFEPGDRLYREGQRAEEVFVLAEGRVSVQFQGVELLTMIAGQAFGGPAILDDSEHESSAVARDRCHVLMLDREELLDLMDRYPTVKTNVLRFMIRNLRALRRRMVGLELRLRDLETAAGSCLSPVQRARERGYDRLLRFAARHNDVPAGEMVLTETVEERGDRSVLRRTLDAAIDVQSEFFGYTHRLEASAWSEEGELIACEASVRENMASVRVEGERRGDLFRLRVTHEDRCEERMLAAGDWQRTDLDAWLLPPIGLPELEPGDRQPVVLLHVNEGQVREGVLRYVGVESLVWRGEKVPVQHVCYEVDGGHRDVWFHAARGVPLRLSISDGRRVTAELEELVGFPDVPVGEAP